jgi:hypothetical protein
LAGPIRDPKARACSVDPPQRHWPAAADLQLLLPAGAAQNGHMAPPAPTRPQEQDPALRPIAALACKQGVSIGLLPAQDRRRALALAWSGLPQGGVHSEAEVNTLLRKVLDGPGRCLRTDHVELRRWLVDEGWLGRDGFGREYRALLLPMLPPACRAAAVPLAGIDVAAWVEGLCRERQAAAEQRRAVWSAQRSAN